MKQTLLTFSTHFGIFSVCFNREAKQTYLPFFMSYFWFTRNYLMIKDSCLHLIIKCVVCSVKLLLLTYYIFFFSLGQIVFPGTENCMKHSKDLLSERNKEQSYMSVGFSLRKKAPKCFENHQQTNCHKAAAALETVVTKCGNVAELTNQSIVDSRRKERKHLIDVITQQTFVGLEDVFNTSSA